jgi:5-formyltetrahydrofolate cyclo-ligase
MPAIDSKKRALRKELRAKRRSLHESEHALSSALAAAAIAKLPAFKPGARIAVYLPFDGESDPTALLAAARRRGVRIFVPVVDSVRHRRLRFLPLTGRTRRGTYGIAVPRGGLPRHAVGPRWFDLIVVPLVGIDAHGRRLGMGGGFYDRALRFRHHRQHWRGPRLVGLAFQCQRADSVFAQPHDVRLDAVATELGIHHFPRNPRT